MEKKVWLGLLLDFYGQALTQRQRSALEQYCLEDYSLSEIAEQEGVSRQGVRDALLRGEKALYAMEEQLQLVKRYLALKQSLLALQSRLAAQGLTQEVASIESMLARWEGQ